MNPIQQLLSVVFSPLSRIWNTLIFIPVFNLLLFINQYTHNMGWSIILLSLGIRLALIGITQKTFKVQQITQGLNPEIAKLKEQYKNDKQGLMAAQAELYKKNGVNPAAGCFPTIILMVVMFSLPHSIDYVFPNPQRPVSLETVNKSILISNLKIKEAGQFSKNFYYLNLTKPDTVPFKIPNFPTTIPLPGLFVIISTILQFISMKMMSPIVEAEKKLAKKTEGKSDDTMADAFAANTNMMPFMNLFLGYIFPSVITLYLIPFTLVQVVQQYFATGWGGLTPWLKKFNLLK